MIIGEEIGVVVALHRISFPVASMRWPLRPCPVLLVDLTFRPGHRSTSHPGFHARGSEAGSSSAQSRSWLEEELHELAGGEVLIIWQEVAALAPPLRFRHRDGAVGRCGGVDCFGEGDVEGRGEVDLKGFFLAAGRLGRGGEGLVGR